MKKQKTIKILALFLIAGAISFLASQNANAENIAWYDPTECRHAAYHGWSTDWQVIDNNGAISNACNNLANYDSWGATEWAAVWLTNGSPDSYGAPNWFNTTIETEKSDGWLDVGMYGQVARRNVYNDGERFAREVKILDYNPGYHNPHEMDGVGGVSWVTSPPPDISLGNFTDSNIWTWPQWYGGMQLNLSEFKNVAQSCGENCFYKNVYVYRCYAIDPYIEVDTWGGIRSVYGGAANDSCSALPSTITLKIKADPEFKTQSTVALGNQRKWTDISDSETVSLNESITLAKDDDGKERTQPVKMTFSHDVFATISNDEGTKYTVVRTINGNNASFSSTSDYSFSPTASSTYTGEMYDFTTPHRDNYFSGHPREVYDSYGDVYATLNDFEAVFYKSGSYTFCEEIIVDGKSTGTKSCAVVEVNPPEDPGDTPDAKLNCGNMRQDSYAGGTAARSGVVDKTSGSPYNNWTEGQTMTAYSDTTSSVTIYAKPGDSIQFLHSLCAGPQAVTGNNGGWTGRGAAIKEKPNGQIKNWFKIEAFPTEKYLFGKNTLLSQNGKVYTITQGFGAKNWVSTHGDESSSYAFTVYSPNYNNNPAYKCQSTRSLLLGWAAWASTAKTFQLSGALSWDCNSGKTVETASHVGKTISQKITFNSVKGWNQYSHSTSGSCGCDKGDAHYNGHRGAFGSYWAAVSGQWSSQGYRQDWACNPPGRCCVITEYYDCRKSYCSQYEDGKCVKREYYWTTCSRCRSDGWRDSYSYTTPTNYGVSAPTSFVDEGERSKTANVKVPYNFTTTVSANAGSNPTYAGESISTWYNFSILKKKNDVVYKNGEYATVTPSNGRYEFIEFTLPASDNGSNIAGNDNANVSNPCAYFSGSTNCNVISSGSGPFNKDGSFNGQSYGGTSSRTVPDLEPGTKYCVALGIFPSDSTNRETPTVSNVESIAMNGGSTWNISGATCRTIAKKPNFQVWNGGIYTNGSISTSTSSKIPGATLGQGGNKLLFGSWDEQVVIAGRGEIKGFASGAALGYGGLNFALPGGRTSTTNMKDLSSLSISNSSSPIGHSYVSRNTATLSRLLARFRTAESTDRLTIINNYGTLYITPEIANRTIKSDGPYNALSDLHQTIIFAKNIEIDPSVTRIDAWLVAEDGYINTCTTFRSGSTQAKDACNQRLDINGLVFAKNLYLNRTAGAGNGSASIDPAEVFNLRADNYLWAYGQAQDFTEAYVTYSRELAPRY